MISSFQHWYVYIYKFLSFISSKRYKTCPFHSLTVAGIHAGSAWDTRVSNRAPTPVVLQFTLSIHSIHIVQHAVIPEGTARSILVVRVERIIKCLSVGKSVVVQTLKGPFADEDGELAVSATDLVGLTADCGGDVLRVSTCCGEEVDVGVDDEVCGGVVEGGPVLFGEEGVLQHQGDAFVDFGDAGEDAVHVRVDPVGSVGGQTGGRGEAGEVVRGLVDGGDGEGVLAVGGFDEG